MSSHPVVRRLTAAALLLTLAAAPALAAPRSTQVHRPQAPRVAVTTGAPMLDRLLGWLGFPAAGDPPGGLGTHEKTGLLPGLHDLLLDLLPVGEQERGGMIDPNG